MIKSTTIVSLSRKELLSFDPCKEGLALFDQIAPNGSIEIEWTDMCAVALVKANSFGPWLSDCGLIPPLRLVNWNGAYLGRAYLGRANLSRAYLSGANLSGADLSRANLSGAYLGRAYLGRANLFGANLSGADLDRANLSGADLFGANLDRANLSGANLSGAIWNQKFPVPSGWKLNEDRLIRA